MCEDTLGSPISHNYVNGVCTMCSKADPNAPIIKLPSFPITVRVNLGGANVAKITSATTRVSGSTIYLTLNGEIVSGTKYINISAFVVGTPNWTKVSEGSVSMRNFSPGQKFSVTIELEDAIRPEFSTDDITLY